MTSSISLKGLEEKQNIDNTCLIEGGRGVGESEENGKGRKGKGRGKKESDFLNILNFH